VVDDCAPDQFMSRVLGEHVDFGIGTPENAAADVDSSMLLRDHLGIVCRRDHPLAALRTVRWADLAGVALTTVRPGYGIRPLIDNTAARAGVRLEVANEVSFLSTALWMASCGMGPALMPTAFAAHAGGAEGGDLVVKPLSAPRASRDIAIVTKRGRSLSPACASFIAVMRDTLKTNSPLPG